MHVFLFKIVVLGCALLQTLGPGWCCVLGQHDQQQLAKTSCCHTPESTQHDRGAEDPTAPQVDCCCSSAEAIVAPAVEPPVSLHLALSESLDLGELGPCYRRGVYAAEPLFDSDPRLHVLQCVWQC